MLTPAEAPASSADGLDFERVPCPSCGSGSARFERALRGFQLERCASCALVFVNPRPTEASLTSLYLRKNPSAQADFYARTISPSQLWEYDRILKDIAGYQPAKGRLLDLGCAAGYFMQRAMAAGFEAHGIDLATWVADITRQRGIANVRVGKLAEAGFPDAWIDAIHSSQVLEHLPEPHGELNEIRRILRPGGILYLNVPNYQCLSIVLGRDDFELNLPPEHVAYYTPRTLKRLLERTGFEVLRTSSYGGLKWENLLGRPIRSEIAEAVRPDADPEAQRRLATAPPPNPGVVESTVRGVLYRGLKVGMTLEAFARKPIGPS